MKKTVAAVAFGAALAMAPAAFAKAQQGTIAFETKGSQMEAPQVQTLDVQDQPGHVLRLVKGHRLFAKGEEPAIAGVKVVEESTQSFSESLSGNGRGWGYITLTLANGAKVYGHLDGSAAFGPDPKKLKALGLVILTGGTGTFGAIRGTIRYWAEIDVEKGRLDETWAGEYTLP